MNEPRPIWVERVRAVLDESSASLDAATLSRLNRARQAALAQRRGARPAAWRWAGGLVAATALGLALLAVLPGRRPAAEAPAPPSAVAHATVPVSGQGPAVADEAWPDAETDLLGPDDPPELVQDLDFYVWLDAQGQQDG